MRRLLIAVLAVVLAAAVVGMFVVGYNASQEWDHTTCGTEEGK